MDEYAELKAQAADFDPVELYKARQGIRPAQEKAAEQQLEDAMQEKPSLIMLLSAKQETSRLLGEDVEERQARQLIAHKRQEQHRIQSANEKEVTLSGNHVKGGGSYESPSLYMGHVVERCADRFHRKIIADIICRSCCVNSYFFLAITHLCKI